MNKDRLPKARNPLSGLLGDKGTTSNESETSNPSKVEFIVDTHKLENESDAGNIDDASNERDFIVRSFKIRREYDELLDRIAFWEHEWKQDVLDEILEREFADEKYREYEPIPPGKKGK